MTATRRRLGLTDVELPRYGLRASEPFDVIGKESQASRSHLVRSAISRDIDFLASSPANGEAERILAAGMIGYRHRVTVMSTLCNPDIAATYREVDVSLHYFDSRIDILVADWTIVTDDLLTSLARTRLMGDAVAIGVACQSLSALREAIGRIVIEGFDVISFPATLLSAAATSALLDEVLARNCGLIAYIPDGLENIRGESLDDMKVNLRAHQLESAADVLFKLALSDDRITSVVRPVRRMRDLDHLELLATTPPFSAAEIDALRTS